MTESTTTSSDGPYFAYERRARIAELVSVRGSVRIGELATAFGVTEATMRKDLTALQEQGLVKRTHGGALALRPIVGRGLAQREETNAAGKRAIAATCVQLLVDGDSIFLDSGTTVDGIALALAQANTRPDRLHLSVLTNTVGIATRLADVAGVDCILLGGQLRSVEGTVVGNLALENLERFTFSSVFLGASGFSELGISVGSLAEAAVKAAVIERARRVVLAVDHTKVGATDFARICTLDEIDVVVMDATTPAVQELCATHGIELIEAST